MQNEEGTTIPESAWTPGVGAPVTPPAEAPRGRSIAVFDPVGIGVDPNVCTVFGDLVRVELMKAGNSVTPRSMMPPETCPDEACASRIGKTLMTKEAVVLRISKLGEKHLILATLVDVESGRSLYADRVTAGSLDDLDVLSVRLARAIDRRVPVSETMTVDTVSAHDSAEQKRQKAVFTTGLRLGGILPVGNSYAGAQSLYAGDIVSYYEVRDYMIEAAVGFRGATNDPDIQVAEWGVDLGAYYHLTQNDISPFVGGGVGLHTIGVRYVDRIDRMTGEKIFVNQQETGPAAYLGFGATILRASDVHLIAQVKYTATFVEIDDQPAHGVMFGLSVSYARKGSMGCCLW